MDLHLLYSILVSGDGESLRNSEWLEAADEDYTTVFDVHLGVLVPIAPHVDQLAYKRNGWPLQMVLSRAVRLLFATDDCCQH